MNFNEIFSKNVTCDNVKSHKKSELQSLFRKHNFRATTMGPPPPPPPASVFRVNLPTLIEL